MRQGKGNRQRVVPLGDRASAWLNKYLAESRPELATNANLTDTLFLSDYGEPMKPHACATHLLDGGADIRYIQEILGHANLVMGG